MSRCSTNLPPSPPLADWWNSIRSSKTNIPRHQETIHLLFFDQWIVQSMVLFVPLCLCNEIRQMSALLLAHAILDWHIQHNLRATGLYARIPIFYKKLCNLPESFSHIIILELHWVYEIISILQIGKATQVVKWPALSSTVRQWTSEHEMTPGGTFSKGTALSNSTCSLSLLCHLSSGNASVSKSSLICCYCSTDFCRECK